MDLTRSRSRSIRVALFPLIACVGLGVGLTVPSSGCIFSDFCIQINYPGTDYCNFLNGAQMWPAGSPELAEPVPPTIGAPGPKGCVCFNAVERDIIDAQVPLAEFESFSAEVALATRQACASAVTPGWDHNCFIAEGEGASLLGADDPFNSGSGQCIGDCSYISPPPKGSCPDPNPYECGGGGEGGDEADGEAGEEEDTSTEADTGGETDTGEETDGDMEGGVDGGKTGGLKAADFVTCVGMTCTIDRDYAEFVVDHVQTLAAEGTIFVFDSGSARFVMQGVEVGSLAATLGLADGDRLEAIDDVVLDGPEAALAALVAHRHAGELRVQILRGTQWLNFTYTLVP